VPASLPFFQDGALPLVALARRLEPPLTILLASLSYHFFELPFLRLKERFTYVPSAPVDVREAQLSATRVALPRDAPVPTSK
jgi:peptidoglycan/LPS O-acetylase OafA/YrhL